MKDPNDTTRRPPARRLTAVDLPGVGHRGGCWRVLAGRRSPRLPAAGLLHLLARAAVLGRRGPGPAGRDLADRDPGEVPSRLRHGHAHLLLRRLPVLGLPGRPCCCGRPRSLRRRPGRAPGGLPGHLQRGPVHAQPGRRRAGAVRGRDPARSRWRHGCPRASSCWPWRSPRSPTSPSTSCWSDVAVALHPRAPVAGDAPGRPALPGLRQPRAAVRRAAGRRWSWAGRRCSCCCCLLPLAAIYANAAMSVQREHQAHHDELTGLPNRKLLLRRTDEALLEAARSGGQGRVPAARPRPVQGGQRHPRAPGRRCRCCSWWRTG